MNHEQGAALLDYLRTASACEPATKWVASELQHTDVTLQSLWNECPVGSWRVWLYARMEIRAPAHELVLLQPITQMLIDGAYARREFRILDVLRQIYEEPQISVERRRVIACDYFHEHMPAASFHELENELMTTPLAVYPPIRGGLLGQLQRYLLLLTYGVEPRPTFYAGMLDNIISKAEQDCYAISTLTYLPNPPEKLRALLG